MRTKEKQLTGQLEIRTALHVKTILTVWAVHFSFPALYSLSTSVFIINIKVQSTCSEVGIPTLQPDLDLFYLQHEGHLTLIHCPPH